MLPSPKDKFQSLVIHNPNGVLKPKKRRKKRKKLQRINNLDWNSLSLKTSTIKMTKSKAFKKSKQYYQHDNRLGQNKSKQTLPTSSEVFEMLNKNFMEREIHYKEVAKKFKPINNVAKNKLSRAVKKNFLKNRSQKNLKTGQKRKLAIARAVSDFGNKTTINPTTTLALMQPQFCLCSCQNDLKKYNFDSYNSNNFELQASVFANINNKKSSCMSAANNPTVTRPNEISTIKIDNSEFFKYLEESSRVRDTHLTAEAQQEKRAKLREAFNISEYFVGASSFDSDRKVKEDIIKSLALKKEMDTQRVETAAMAAKETSKRYALGRTPSMEHDLPKSVGGLATDKSESPLKKKKKKKIRESSPSPERKKDKKKKSKKSKKESKPKKSKKDRRRKGSESETNADDDVDEDSGSDETEADAKKSRKKSKKDKKKRRNKRKEVSSSDEKRSMSISDKTAKDKKYETLMEKKYYDYHSRSRSKEKSNKLKASQRHRYEPSYNRSRPDNSPSNKIKSRSHSNRNRSNNSEEGRDHRYKEKNFNLKRSSRSRDDYSRDRNSTPHRSNNCDNRRSRSLLRTKHDTTDENVKNLKRKHNDKYLFRNDESPSTDKRKRYSQSQSSSTTKSCEKITLATAETEIHSYKRHSRTPNRKRSDIKQSKHISRSSSPKSSLRKKSRSSTPKTSKNTEPSRIEKNIKHQKKSDIITIHKNKGKNNICETSRSRSNSLSSQTTSTTDTRISKSRTPPKIKYIEKHYVPNSLDSPKLKEQKLNSPSPVITPTSTQRRSTSTSQLRFVINEKRRIFKRSSSSSKERLNCRKENRDQKSRTPPPKIEKKTLSPRSSRDSSELSYSPARRNPERYRNILENTKNEKGKISENIEERKEIECDRKEKGGKNEISQTKPVVRLQSQSDEESDATERNTEKNLDEFQVFKREREINDFKMLEHLKTGLAAKAKEKIKSIEKMSENLSTNIDGEVSDKSYKRIVRNSLNDFLAANNVPPAVVATCSSSTYNGKSNSTLGAIYPQTFEEIKKEQEALLQLTDNLNSFDNNKETKMDNETVNDCKKSSMTANVQVLTINPTASPVGNNINATYKEKDRKREHDLRERESYNFNKDRYFDRRQKSNPGFYNTGGGGIGGGTLAGGNMSVGRRNSNSSMLNINHRQRSNMFCNSGCIGAHHHPNSHLHPHHHHPNHKIINNHHNSAASSYFLANNSSTNPHSLLCNHSNNSTYLPFSRPSRINNSPLITATQFNNQMLSKQSNSILVNRRDHRTALNLGLSGTPCTNFSNSNLLLTKANTNPHHLHATAVGHVVGGGHHHHHHHSQNTGMSSGGSSSATQITDRILMAASLAAAQRHRLGIHSTVSNAAAVAAANNLNFLHQQNKPKLVIKPFKINDSQPLVAALADSSLVDAIVSKVSTATVAAAESAARRSRSRSRRSQSRNRHDEKSSGASNSGGGERDGNRRRSVSRSRSSRSSTSSRSRGRSHSHRSSRSRTSQSSSSTHTSSRSSSSSSLGTSRSGTRSPSIPRRRGSPSFLDRRRITSARKRPIPYHRKLSSDVSSCYCSSCCSRESSPHSRSPSRNSRSPSRFFET